MTEIDRAPCQGKHRLFDSTQPEDHALAAQFCATCPVLAACADRLADLVANVGYYGHPEGTWAGQLLTDGNDRNHIRRLAHESRRERTEREEAAFSDREARQAHSAYSGGDRSAWAAMGHRVYQRRQKRAQRLAVAS